MRKDLTGVKFNRLTIVRQFLNMDLEQTQRYRADCMCECGNLVTGINIRSVTRGSTKSCGCLRREKTSDRFRTVKNIPLSDLHKNHENCLRVWYCMFGYWPKFLRVGFTPELSETAMVSEENPGDSIAIKANGTITKRLGPTLSWFNSFKIVELLKALNYYANESQHFFR